MDKIESPKQNQLSLKSYRKPSIASSASSKSSVQNSASARELVSILPQGQRAPVNSMIKSLRKSIDEQDHLLQMMHGQHAETQAKKDRALKMLHRVENERKFVEKMEFKLEYNIPSLYVSLKPQKKAPAVLIPRMSKTVMAYDAKGSSPFLSVRETAAAAAATAPRPSRQLQSPLIQFPSSVASLQNSDGMSIKQSPTQNPKNSVSFEKYESSPNFNIQKVQSTEAPMQTLEGFLQGDDLPQKTPQSRREMTYPAKQASVHWDSPVVGSSDGRETFPEEEKTAAAEKQQNNHRRAASSVISSTRTPTHFYRRKNYKSYYASTNANSPASTPALHSAFSQRFQKNYNSGNEASPRTLTLKKALEQLDLPKSFTPQNKTNRRTLSRRRRTAQGYRRERNFDFIPITRTFVYEGMSYVQYQSYVRRDANIQPLIIRGLLDIVSDKVHTLRQPFLKVQFARKVFRNMGLVEKGAFNSKMEQTVRLLEIICNEILMGVNSSSILECTSPLAELQLVHDTSEDFEAQEEEQNRKVLEQQQALAEQEAERVKNPFPWISQPVGSRQWRIEVRQHLEQEEDRRRRAQAQKQGSSASAPLSEQEKKRIEELVNQKMQTLMTQEHNYEPSWLHRVVRRSEDEIIAFSENIYFLDKMSDYYRECVGIFRVIQRLARQKRFSDERCVQLLQILSQCRIYLSELSENYKVEEKNFQEKLQSTQQNQESNQVKIANTAANRQQEAKDEARKQVKAERLQQLLMQKFKYVGSNLDSNQERVAERRMEEERDLLLESQLKNFSLDDNVCDNRKRIKLEKLRDPFRSMEVSQALKVARSLPNLTVPLEVEAILYKNRKDLNM